MPRKGDEDVGRQPGTPNLVELTGEFMTPSSPTASCNKGRGCFGSKEVEIGSHGQLADPGKKSRRDAGRKKEALGLGSPEVGEGRFFNISIIDSTMAFGTIPEDLEK